MTDDTFTQPAPETGGAPEPGRFGFGQIVAGALLILLGGAWLIESLDWADVPWRALLAAALIVVGIALMVGARHGSHGGLIAFGIVLAVVMALSSALAVLADIPLTGGIGEQRLHPVAAVDDEYHWGIGSMTVDLRDAGGLDGRTIEATVAIGELIVYVPDGLAVRIDARAGIGEVRVDGRSSGGFDADLTVDDGDAQLVLDLDVAIGKVEVRR
ncbi:MAG: cell wall-active antibiotics response protein [Actinobacteria bacterium]|nr:cell wall-active antibiotics response protein [Actinomycetota bacterium]